MAEWEVFIRNSESEYKDGVMVNEYGNTVSLVAARESQNGNVYKDWCFPQDKDRKPKEKSVPFGVRLGTKRNAIEMLLQAAEALGWKRGDASPTPDDDDIPF